MPLDCCAGTFECIMVGPSLLMKVGFLDDTMLGWFDALETGELLVATLGRCDFSDVGDALGADDRLLLGAALC